MKNEENHEVARQGRSVVHPGGRSGGARKGNKEQEEMEGGKRESEEARPWRKQGMERRQAKRKRVTGDGRGKENATVGEVGRGAWGGQGTEESEGNVGQGRRRGKQKTRQGQGQGQGRGTRGSPPQTVR